MNDNIKINIIVLVVGWSIVFALIFFIRLFKPHIILGDEQVCQ